VSTLPRTAESLSLVSPLPTSSVLPSPFTRSPVRSEYQSLPFDEVCNVGYGACEFVEQDLDTEKASVTVYKNSLLLCKHVISVCLLQSPSVNHVS
jgi:hypothetical protein